MDLHKIAKVTRLHTLSKGRMLLIAAAVGWSAINCGLGSNSAAEAASLVALSSGALSASADVTRISGIPYKNRHGEVVMSGSMAEKDYLLVGCAAQAQAEYNRARAIEPAITMDMLEIADELGTSMDGLEYAVKTATSVKSKIERKADKALQAGTLPKSDKEYVQETNDLIRYTQVVNHNEMATATKKTIRLLEEKGYTVEQVDNKYLNPVNRYKAIHLDIVNPAGVHFEMQIHSPETIQANKATHAMYEEWRKPETPAPRKAELYAHIKGIYDAVPPPADIMSVANYPA